MAAWGTDENESFADTEDLFDQQETADVLDNTALAERPDIVPDGWSIEDFHRWLDGPLPEGWTTEQWTRYVQEAKTTLSAHDTQAEG